MSADTHIPSSGDAPNGKVVPLSERDVARRESFVRYVMWEPAL